MKKVLGSLVSSSPTGYICPSTTPLKPKRDNIYDRGIKRAKELLLVKKYSHILTFLTPLLWRTASLRKYQSMAGLFQGKQFKKGVEWAAQ